MVVGCNRSVLIFDTRLITLYCRDKDIGEPGNKLRSEVRRRSSKKYRWPLYEWMKHKWDVSGGKSTACRSPLKAESVEVKDREGMLKDIYKLDNGVLIFLGKKTFFLSTAYISRPISKNMRAGTISVGGAYSSCPKVELSVSTCLQFIIKWTWSFVVKQVRYLQRHHLPFKCHKVMVA